MPAESKKQSRYLNMKFGHEWVKEHHFDNSTQGLPEHAGKPGKKKKSDKSVAHSNMTKIAKGLRA